MAEFKKKPSNQKSGLYEAKITGQRFGKSKTKGTPFFEVDISVLRRLPPENAPEPLSTPLNRRVTMYLSEGNITKGFAFEKIKACGTTCSSLSQLDPATADYDDLTGNVVKVLHHADDMYDWQIFTAGGAPRESDPDVAASLDNLFGGDFAATPDVDQAVPAVDKPAETIAPAEGLEPATAAALDDMPF